MSSTVDDFLVEALKGEKEDWWNGRRVGIEEKEDQLCRDAVSSWYHKNIAPAGTHENGLIYIQAKSLRY